MANRKFNIAFSSMATLPFPRFLSMVLKYPIDLKYIPRCCIAGLISLCIEPFRWIEKLFYDRKLAKTAMPESPVFILGHWRSGTTLLHNALCQDEQFAYVNTYQSVFTNQFFANRWLFKPLMKWLMPEKRPADNVLLSLDLPQEEELALCNAQSFSFYNFFYFPRQWKAFYDKYITCTTSTENDKQKFGVRYKKLIAQALLEYDKKEFISKNPPNTGRIPELLNLFPKARFIYIYRNPVKVFLSTANFFQVTLEPLQLQSYSRREFEEFVFELHERIIRDYESQKALIPPGHLIEIRYEDFEQDPLSGLELIYNTLNMPGFDAARPAFEAYFESQKKFEKGSHTVDEERLKEIHARCAFSLQHYGYLAAKSEMTAT